MGNGGLVKPDAYINRPPRMGVQITSSIPRGMYHGQVKSYRGPLKEATVWRYYGDGQGRDSYMCKDSGGLIPSYESTSPDRIFFSQLRQSDTRSPTGSQIGVGNGANG